MNNNKPSCFKIFGCDAIFSNKIDGIAIEVSAPNEDIGAKIMLKLGGAILDKKIKSLRINLPNKIAFVTAKDRQNLLIRGEESDNKRVMN